MTNIEIGEFLYVREIYEDYEWEIENFYYRFEYLLWEACASGLSDVFWDDVFFPDDNYMYHECRYFLIYTEDVRLFWI